MTRADGAHHVPEPEDRFGAVDDTLHDGDDATPEVPPQARPWCMQQRFVHGMLRALHTADAAAREARVQAVMRQVAARPMLTRRLVTAAAVLAAAALAVYAIWPDPARLPRAEAMVAKAIAALSAPVDREFALSIEVERGGRRTTRDMQITLRPGRRFLVAAESPLGEFRAGCDGETVWFQPAATQFRTSVPLADARRLTERLGDVLDLGYLDLETLLRRLPQDTELRCVARVRGGIKVAAIGAVKLRHLDVRSIEMVVDDDTGLLRSIDAVAKAEGRTREVAARLQYRHVANHELGEAAYRRPW
jgi:hypothetical protein